MTLNSVTYKRPKNGVINDLQKIDAPIHGWYRFVLSYPPHLVQEFFKRFQMSDKNLVLDPFCGTGTTLVEAKKLGIPSVGCDAHPFAALVSRVKTNWDLKPKHLRKILLELLRSAQSVMTRHGLPSLSFSHELFQETVDVHPRGYALTMQEKKLLPTGFLSRSPRRRLLILREQIEAVTSQESQAVKEFFLLALAHVIANGAGNFSFGPEIYRTKEKPDYDVLGHFALHVDTMISELANVGDRSDVSCEVFQSDARTLEGVPNGLSAVITSPPYPNEKDYTRTTRVESLLLRLLSDRASLRHVKESMLRSNTRNVFVKDRDAEEVLEFPMIQEVCEVIEKRRIELGKTSGFEKLYHKVVAHYFGGMRRHFRALRPKLKLNAKLAYVVGDQFSFLMVPVPTAKLLAIVAEAEGFRVIGCELWRERTGTKVRNDRAGRTTIKSREEILLLERI